MTKCVVSFILSFMILTENVDFRVLPWGGLDGAVRFSHFRGALCLVEDKRLRKCFISGGSATPWILPNNFRSNINP